MLLNNPNMALASFTVQPVFALICPLPTSLSKGITWTSFVLLWNDPDDQGLAGRWWHKGLYNASDWTHAFVTDSAQIPQLWNVRWTVHTFKFIAYMFYLMYLQAIKSNQSNNTCKLGNVCTDTLCYYTCMHNVYTCIRLIMQNYMQIMRFPTCVMTSVFCTYFCCFPLDTIQIKLNEMTSFHFGYFHM